MYELKPETKQHIKETIERELGVPYEVFIELDFDDQQKLIKKHKKKKKRNNQDEVIMMIGEGEHSIFTKVKKGELVMIGSGEHSIFVKAGVTPEEEKQELDDKLDDVLYSKPVAFVKKIQRRIKNNNPLSK